MHLPGVGENFEDHLEVYIQHKCKQPVSLQPLDVKRMPFIGLQWIFARKGAAASNHFEGGGFVDQMMMLIIQTSCSTSYQLL